MALNSLTGFLTNVDPALSGAGLGGFIIAMAVLGIIFFIVAIGIYVYTSLAFSRIAKRLNQSSPGIAWIPGFGPLIVAYRQSEKNSKPWWALLIGFIGLIVGMILMSLGIFSSALMIIGALIALAAVVVLIYFTAYAYIWTWKMFEALQRPGWWAIIPLFGIPFIFLGLIPYVGIIFVGINYAVSIWYLVMIGIAAWGNTETAPKVEKKEEKSAEQPAQPREAKKLEKNIAKKKAPAKNAKKKK